MHEEVLHNVFEPTSSMGTRDILKHMFSSSSTRARIVFGPCRDHHREEARLIGHFLLRQDHEFGR
jgi:hypothetical protein